MAHTPPGETGLAPPPRYLHLNGPDGRLVRWGDLVLALMVREFKGQYRRSLLGPAWALLQPLAYLLVFLFLRGVLDIHSGSVPYALFAYVALVPWTFFANAVTRCGPSVQANAGILKKVAVPREVFPLAAVATALLDLLFSGVLLAGFMVWYQTPVSWVLLWLPVLMALLVLLALGVGLGLAAVGTFKRDILFATPFLLQFWMLATPVIYPASQVPERWRSLFDLNPLVGLIEGFRSVILQGQTPDMHLLGGSLVGVFLVWLLAWPLFRSVSRHFADVL
ncbi:MAG: ABC transporter permease [Magnetococcus sp. WYHC-3]